MLEDRADLGLVSYPEPSRELTVIPWRREEMVLCASPDHPIAKRAAQVAVARARGEAFPIPATPVFMEGSAR